MHRKTTQALSLLLVLCMVFGLVAFSSVKSSADVILPPDVFKDETTSPSAESTEAEPVETKPTEAEPTETASSEAESTETEPTVTDLTEPVCAHEQTELRDAVIATCTEPGYSGDRYCADCGEKLADGIEIAALGHDYVPTVTAPDCEFGGYTTYTCSRCNDAYTAEETPALGHIDENADCVCDVCEAAIMPIETEPVTTEPTETEPITTEPIATEPITTEPIETEPIATEPITTEPIETEPIATEPITTEPIETEPIATEPITTEPIATEPIETEPVATEPTETEPIETEPTELTDEELIEMYQIPEGWSRDALLFAVRNGLLRGSGDGTLNPTRTATRAEIATILAGALPTELRADLSVYTDLVPDAWYDEPLGHAVALGLISGTGNNKMSPNGLATREQAIAIIARAFGLTDGDRSDLYGFKDWLTVSEWAVPSMSAMVKAGYVAGTDGCLNPKRNITRQEFAQIIYSIVDRFAPTELTETDGMTVTYITEIPAGTVINGDLLICNDATELTLDHITVTGRLILQGAGLLHLTVTDCDIHELVLCRPTELTADGSVSDIIAAGDITVHGKADLITMAGGNVTLAEDAEVKKLTADDRAKGTSLTVNGTLQLAQLTTELALNGTGKVERASVCASSFDPDLLPDAVDYTHDPGLSGLKLNATPSGMPSESDPLKTVTLCFDGELPAGPCEVVWYLDSKYQCIDAGVTLTPSLRLAHQFDFSGDFTNYANRVIGIVIRYRGQSEMYGFNIPIRQAYLMYELSDVKTMDIPATVNYTATIYSDMAMTKSIGTVKKGTTVVYKAYDETTAAQILLPNGTLGWVKYNAITISRAGYYTGKDYTKEVKEAWVNKKGYSSRTSYLVWTNLYTQRINIFKGSKGNWKLVFVSQCATGSNLTPTPQEVTQIYYKSNKWYYDDFYVHHISVFDSSRGFHSMLYNYDSYTLFNTAMGCPASHGCVRVPDEGIMYLWNDVPVNSTVVIY